MKIYIVYRDLGGYLPFAEERAANRFKNDQSDSFQSRIVEHKIVEGY